VAGAIFEDVVVAQDQAVATTPIPQIIQILTPLVLKIKMKGRSASSVRDMGTQFMIVGIGSTKSMFPHGMEVPNQLDKGHKSPHHLLFRIMELILTGTSTPDLLIISPMI